jgi:transposase
MKPSKAKQIEYRRNLVGEMLVEAKTHQEIAESLTVSRQTISTAEGARFIYIIMACSAPDLI